MVRSRSRFTVCLQALAVAAFLAATLAGLTAPAQSSPFGHHETNANRRARIERQIKETYTHRWEVGGGGGYLRFRSGQYTQRNSEIAFWANTTYFLNPKLGITGEIRGAYGNAKVPNLNPFGSLVGSPQISEYPYLAGVTYRLRSTEKTSVGVFALGGAAIGKFDGGSKGISAPLLGFWPSSVARPAFSGGLNLDYNFYPNLAFRLAPSYLGTTFGGTLQNNAGFEMGLLYRFGRQK
jgi:hypothetical protein